ncbi:DUF350 domain-containing protein [Metabacillus malikii]|uniref:Membrane protein n=1 Tax=Metabacillus malikii TaxID=1504265 RepID=A0ABT9ZGW5_9BACI|nr:DUF350 domain-containing protein [Metabacillus malikii]MDQ0230778.1 putative membrane protein [Metabacillus malikii]
MNKVTFIDLFLSTISYIGLACLLLLVGIFLFEVTTKNKEFTLISKGNKAAVYAFGGRILGLAIVLYASISNSVNLWDMLIWGGVAIIIQIVIFYLAELLTPKFNITQAIDDDNQAVGLFLLFLSVAIGLIIAASLTY